MKHKDTPYGSRYRHKLNMLEPGMVMLKAVGALAVAGCIGWTAGLHRLFILAVLLAGAVLAVLLILVAVELHQDKVLNEIALRERKKGKP